MTDIKKCTALREQSALFVQETEDCMTCTAAIFTDLPLEWEAITGPAKKLNNKLRE